MSAPSLTPADLLPGVSLLCDDPEQPTAPPIIALDLTPCAILRAGRDSITIVSVDAAVTALVDGRLWVWPRRSTERVLATMGFRPAGHEDADVLAERVLVARAEARARRVVA